MIYDFVIVGAGIAGAGLAAELSDQGSTLLLEMEALPAYHTTGRSNALWHVTYGGPKIEPLTTASKPWFDCPPVELDAPLLTHRGGVQIAEHGRQAAIEDFIAQFAGSTVELSPVNGDALREMISGLRPGWEHGIFEPDIYDIDVAGLHASFMKVAKAKGCELRCNAEVSAISRRLGHWRLETRAGAFDARILVNAAGAWADQLAALAGCQPLGIQPLRRTIVQVELARPVAADTPFVADIDGRFYFKPEGEYRAWVSPADETPVAACDAAPDQLDVAIAVDWLEKVVDWPVNRVEHKWAGLRSFAPDRLPVFGFDPDIEDFFWCAGQGGFGIQTAPAASAFCAALISGDVVKGVMADLQPTTYSPSRFRDEAYFSSVTGAVADD